jgi:hypothetical protein
METKGLTKKRLSAIDKLQLATQFYNVNILSGDSAVAWYNAKAIEFKVDYSEDIGMINSGSILCIADAKEPKNVIFLGASGNYKDVKYFITKVLYPMANAEFLYKQNNK